jgi:hypothetical protein
LCWAGTDTSQIKNEIQYVLPRDAIPAIKNPEFVPAEEAGLDDHEPVVGITINGESRAYSLYLLNHHEIVNDRIGDTVFAVTWCPLANLAVIYNREIDDKEYAFGVSGKLLKNTLVMFDYETESFWPIAYGEAVDGELTGKKLNSIPGCKRCRGVHGKNYTRIHLYFLIKVQGQLVMTLMENIIRMKKQVFFLPEI